MLIDNDPNHMSDEVEVEICATGDILIYRAPYNLHLNPVENYYLNTKIV